MESKKITDLIISRYNRERTLIVGIDGAGGAGKSTISDTLEKELRSKGYNVAVFHIDDMIHPRAVRYNDDYPQWEQYYYLQWRYDYFMREVISPIREGRSLGPIELYDKENDSYKTVLSDIPAGSIVIVEGVFLLRSELEGAFDVTVYIDVSKEERLERVLKRDGYIGDSEAILKKYNERYFPAEDHYLEECSPKEKADIII